MDPRKEENDPFATFKVETVMLEVIAVDPRKEENCPTNVFMLVTVAVENDSHPSVALDTRASGTCVTGTIKLEKSVEVTLSIGTVKVDAVMVDPSNEEVQNRFSLKDEAYMVEICS